jgi:hypothetical protein
VGSREVAQRIMSWRKSKSPNRGNRTPHDVPSVASAATKTSKSRKLRHTVNLTDEKASLMCSAWSTAQEYHTASLLQALYRHFPGSTLESVTLPASGTQIWWLDHIHHQSLNENVSEEKDKNAHKYVNYNRIADNRENVSTTHQNSSEASLAESSGKFHRQNESSLDELSNGNKASLPDCYISAPRVFLFDDGSMVFWNSTQEVMRRARKIAYCGGFEVNAYSNAIVESENEEMPFAVDEDGRHEIPRLHSGVMRFPAALTSQDAILYQYAFSNSAVWQCR